MVAINSRNGEILWKLKEKNDADHTSATIIDLYTVNAIRDFNDDQVPDVIAVHVEEMELARLGHIKIISGKDGNEIRSILTPFKEEVFVPIQVITQADGSECLLIITGGQNSAGGIYLLRTQALMQSKEVVFNMFYLLFR